MPTMIISGDNAVKNNSKDLILGKKAMIVTGKTSGEKSGALSDVLNVLEENGVKYLVYNKIGNKDYRMYKVRLTPKADSQGGWYIEKPCNFDSVEAITLDYESAQSTHNYDYNAGAIN